MPNGLELYLTGASADGATQEFPALSLGGYRSCVPLRRLGVQITDPIPEIIIERVSGDCGEGDGLLVAVTTDSLTFKAPGDTVGTAVSIANGETKTIASNDADKWVQVTRDSANDMAGSMTLTLAKPFNSVVGGEDTTSAGTTEYHGAMFNASAAVTNLYVWIGAGLSVAWEVPDADDKIQEIATLATAPAAVSWNSGMSLGAGLSLASLASGSNYGLWFRRVVAPASAGSAKDETSIYMQWTSGGNTYTEFIPGLFRTSHAAGAQYELYAGVDTAPDFASAPAATSATETIDYALTPPGSGTRTYHLVVRYRNDYGLLSGNIFERLIEIDTNGDEVIPVPSAPTNITVVDSVGGELRVNAEYLPSDDSYPANTWRIYVRADGVDPVAGVDTPTEISMAASVIYPTAGRVLNTTIGPYPLDSDVRVLVTAYRSSSAAESTNTTATSITVGTTDPASPKVGRLFAGIANLLMGTRNSIETTTTYDATYSVTGEIHSGYTDFKVGSTVLFRLRYDSANPANNGFWTTLAVDQILHSAAASDDPVDVVSATEMYVTVDSVRRLKIDATAGTIEFARLTQTAIASLVSCRSALPFKAFSGVTCFQVYDPYTGDFVTAATLSNAGVFSIGVPWRQRATVGEFE